MPNYRSLLGFLANRGLVWPGYFVLTGLISALFFGSLKDHMLDVHDSETFQDNISIGEDFSFFFSPEKKQSTGRPAADLVKFLAYSVWSNDPGLYHLLVVALHTLAALLLALLARSLGMSLRVSLVGGLLFLINVAHFQVVHHISALDYPLALSLGLGALLFYLRYLSTRRWRYLGGFYFGFALSILSLAAMAFLWPFCLYWSWSKGYDIKNSLRLLLPLLGLTTVELVFIVAITPEETNTGRAIGLWEHDPFGLLGGMGRLLLWALGRLVTTAHWLLVPLYEFQPWETYVGAGILAGLLFLVYRRHCFESLWTLWILLSLLPFLPITDTGILIRPSGPSRYLYLATAGSSVLFCVGNRGNMSARQFLGPISVRRPLSRSLPQQLSLPKPFQGAFLLYLGQELYRARRYPDRDRATETGHTPGAKCN